MMDEKRSAWDKTFDGVIAGHLQRLVQRHYRLLSFLIIIVVLFIIPLKIMSYGYRPLDDAMRHSAHALDTRGWDEIVVQRGGAVADTSPGWDFLLRNLHALFDWDQETLLVFSTVFLCMLFLYTGLFLVRNGFAWLIALTTAAVICPVIVMRINIGRPYIITMCSVMAVVMIWRSVDKISLRNVLLTVLLFMVSAWFHGSWYIAVLVPVSFFLVGRFAVAMTLGGCWLIGSFAGAVMTGEPFAYMIQQISHGVLALGEHTMQRQLVGEFQSSLPNGLLVLVVAVIIIIQMVMNKKTLRQITLDPVFMLFMIGMVLGIGVDRFYLDWGLPAGILWMAVQWNSCISAAQIERKYPLYCMGVTVLVAVILYFSCIVDVKERWTRNLEHELIDGSDPELSDWLPGDDGIVYSDSMRVFYRTYFQNPNAPWKYILGYEAGLMPEDDLKIFRSIQWNKFIPAAYTPWVEKMRPQDRMILIRNGKPDVLGLDWHLAANDTWIGRVVAEGNVPEEEK